MKKKLIKIGFTALMLCCIFSLNIYNSSTIVLKASNDTTEEKIYCNATIDDSFVDNQVLVTLNKEASFSQKEYTVADFNEINCIEVRNLTSEATLVAQGKKENYLVNLDNFNRVLLLSLDQHSKQNVLETIDILIERDDVVYAEPNYQLELESTSGDNEPTTYSSSYDWAIEDLQLEEAWEYSAGSSTIKVGVLDSGIDGDHESLVNNLSNTHYDATSGDEIAITSLTDEDGHGTTVAGIIGGNSNYYKGVCPNIELISIKINKDFSADYLFEAIEYATLNLIPILNLSIVYHNRANILENDTRSLSEKLSHYKGLIICAAGNEGINIDSNNIDTTLENVYPSLLTLNNIISVGAINSSDERWGNPYNGKSSNYGSNSVDIFAPGDEIYTTVNDGGYHFDCGTSMAAPFVTGVAALIKSLSNGITVDQIKNSILNSAETIQITLPNNNHQSVKKLNALNAVEYAIKNYIFDTYNLTSETDISSSYNVFRDSELIDIRNVLAKFDVQYSDTYDFALTANIPINCSLYNEAGEEIELSITKNSYNTEITFNEHLQTGIYYFRITPIELGYADVGFSITGNHEHNFNNECSYHSTTEHSAKCDCGMAGYENHLWNNDYEYASTTHHRVTCTKCHYIHLLPHTVLSGSKICIDCKGNVEMGFVGPNSANRNLVSDNGSYILSNGIIVLVNEDLESYLNGTLIFYLKEDNKETM